MTHEETKKLIDAYHKRAAEIYNCHDITVSGVKNVQLMADGAFVEAMVWVSREELNDEKENNG